MQITKRCILLWLCLSVTCVSVIAQKVDSLSALDRIAGFPVRFLDRINKKASRLEGDVVKNTEKYLQQLAPVFTNQQYLLYLQKKRVLVSSH